ncbi:MAG: hypothetical protein PWQ57_3407 [Desulfovibrionales bacterium]|nr:hypothetical protein [Desulfovibrionales bacterium]
MRSMHAMFENICKEQYYRVLVSIIKEKLEDFGLNLSDSKNDELIKRLTESRDAAATIKEFDFGIDSDREISISLTKTDLERVADACKRIHGDNLHSVILDFLEDISSMTVESLHKEWESQRAYEDDVLENFKKQLFEIWGKAIEGLRMLVSLAREFGADFNRYIRKRIDNKNPFLTDVLTRLHARSCQLADEIVCLLSSGHSDGAMARWRTLHEIAAVSLLISKHGEDLATRYVKHEAIEAYKAARDYNECCHRLGYPPLDSDELESLSRDRDELVDKYGKEYKNQYGWASEVVKNSNPNLRILIEASGIGHFKAHYRLASHNVHANPKGVYCRLGLLDNTGLLLAGPSDVGLCEPGQNASISLLQVTASLLSLDVTLDILVYFKVLEKVSQEVQDLFVEIDENVEGR